MTTATPLVTHGVLVGRRARCRTGVSRQVRRVPRRGGRLARLPSIAARL